MSVVANNATSYQWQRSADGQTWSNISTTNTNYKDAKTATLTVKINKTTANYVYRCIVRNAESSVTSENVSVSIAEPALPLEITEHPESVFGEIGEEKTMSVVANNATSYQWQRSADGETWLNISSTNKNYADVKTDTLTIKINNTTKAYLYRCIVKNDDGESIASVAAEVKTGVAITFDANGGHFYGKENVTIKNFTVAPGTYAWEAHDPYFDVSYELLNDGYAFDGWYYDSECTERADFYSIVVSDDITLYAGWSEPIVYITWNSNGGYISGDPNCSEYTEPLVNWIDHIHTCERPGYVFDGWYNEPECVSHVDFEGDAYTGNVTIYAGWVEAVSVTWDGNGGYIWGETDRPTYTNSLRKGSTVSPEWARRSGYAFEGWYLDAACTESVDFGSFILTQDVTFYAKWGDPTYAYWDCNGGSLVVDGDNYSIYPEALQNNQYINTHYWNPEKKGFVFCGWYLDKDCTEQPDYYYYLTENVTFYAKWADEVNVTWDANGGYIGGGELTYTQQLGKGTYLNTSQYAFRDGYTFDGWYLDKACTQPLTNWWEYIVSEDVTFYAKWDETASVTWDGNGGYIWGSSTYVEYVAKGSALDHSYIDVPERYGFDFEGWYLDADCTISVDPLGYVVTGDVTFYAKWSAVYITWDCCGGYTVFAGESMPSWQEAVGKDTILSHCIIPTRDGYVLEGWYLDAEYKDQVILGEYIVTQDVTLYAKWAEAIYVTWDCNGGNIWGEPTYTDSVLQNTTLVACYPPTPERSGYAFAGWCSDADCTELVDRYDYVITENVTFYAKWVDAVYITWNFNGGYVEPSEFIYLYSDTTPIAKNSMMDSNYFYYTPYRSDYVFGGWYLDAECTERVDLYTYYFENDVTFYAKWISPEDSVTITWDANGGNINGDPYCWTLSEAVEKGTDLNTVYRNAERDGYNFDGWYYDAEGTERVVFDPGTTFATESLTLYAKWSCNQAAVSSITCSEPLRLLENVDGFVGADDSFFYTYKHSESYGDVLNEYSFALTVNYSDGTSFTGCCDEINALGFGGVYFSDDQLYTRWTVGGENYITVSYRGVQSRIPVTIVSNPVTGFSCSSSIQISEYTNGEYLWYNGDPFFKYYTSQRVWMGYDSLKYYDDFYNQDVIYTVEFSDRDPVVGNAKTIYEQTGICLHFSDDDQWTEHWYAGGTYYITANLAGYTTSIPVSIVQKEVASITCENPLVLLENVDGNYTSYFGEEYFHYDYKHAESYGDVLNEYSFRLTINYTDGTSFTGYCDEINALGFGGVYFCDDQEYNHWTVGGENYLTASYRGIQSQLPVKISRNTVTSITCSDTIEIIENTNGQMERYNGDPFYKYYASGRYWVTDSKYVDTFSGHDLIYTVEFSDREPLVGNAGTLYRQTGFSLGISGDDQWTEHWVAGETYYITIEFAGQSTSVPVTIVPHHVSSVTCNGTLNLDQNSNGYYSDEGRYCYYWYYYSMDANLDTYSSVTDPNLTFTISYDDGREDLIGTCYDIFEQTNIYFEFSGDNQERDPWLPGRSYTVEYSYGGVIGTLDVYIVPSTNEVGVSSITCSRPLELVENVDGYYTSILGDEFFWYSYMHSESYGDVLNEYDFELTVNYSDGSSFTGTCDEINALGYGGVYFSASQDVYHWTVGGKNYITVSYRGVESKIPVSIIRNNVTGISCSNTIEIIDNTNGRLSTYNGEFFYLYNASQPVYVNYDSGKYYDEFYGQDLIYTVEFSDRNPIVGNSQELYEQTGLCLTLSGDEQWTEHWEVGGTYYITAMFAGCETSIPVTIVETPISNVTVEPDIVHTVVNQNGHYEFFMGADPSGDYEYFVYEPEKVLSSVVFKITYIDGSAIEGTLSELNANGDFSFGSSMYYWGIGEYEISCCYQGYTFTIPVSVDDLVIESFSLSSNSVDVSDEMLDNSGRFYQLDDVLDDMTYTVVYNGGQTKSGSKEEIKSFIGHSIGYSTTQYETPWEENHSYEVRVYLYQFENISFTLEANVLPHTIQSVSCNQELVQVSLYDLEYYDWPDFDEYGNVIGGLTLYELNKYLDNYGIEFNVILADGGTYTGTRTDIFNYFGLWIDANCLRSFDDRLEIGSTYSLDLQLYGNALGTITIRFCDD